MNWGTVAAFSGFILMLFGYIDSSPKAEVRSKLVNWLTAKDFDYRLSTIIYDSLHRFWKHRAFLKSTIISIVSFAIVYHATVGLDEIKPEERWVFLLVPPLALVIPDYISLNQTMFYLRLMSKYKNIWASITILFADFATTLWLSFFNVLFLLAFPGELMITYLGILVIIGVISRFKGRTWINYIIKFLRVLLIIFGSISTLLLAAMLISTLFGVASEDSSWKTHPDYDAIFATTFFTSLWIYLYFLSIILTKSLIIMSKGTVSFLGFIDVRERPFTALGIVSAISLIVVCGIIDFLFI